METVPLHFAVFLSSVCLRFFPEGFSERTLERESGVFGEGFWLKNALFASRKWRKTKFSLS